MLLKCWAHLIKTVNIITLISLMHVVIWVALKIIKTSPHCCCNACAIQSSCKHRSYFKKLNLCICWKHLEKSVLKAALPNQAQKVWAANSWKLWEYFGNQTGLLFWLGSTALMLAKGLVFESSWMAIAVWGGGTCGENLICLLTGLRVGGGSGVLLEQVLSD